MQREQSNHANHHGVMHEENKSDSHSNHGHQNHAMKSIEDMSLLEKVKMSMSMTMGMDHTGLAGREMARLMELDIRNKFFFSLIFTVPIFLYTMGEMIFGIMMPEFMPKSWLLFLLTTPVFFYGGWLFLYSAFHSLRSRKLDMSVLIAVGIVAAYVFSVVLTFIGSEETYYEAAAMLITFVLFGHWMEMKSRRGTTDALQALFALVPDQARIDRDGKETIVATDEVKLNDIIILKPGDKVPVDGVVTEGETSIDESLITGESIPVTKKVEDRVVAGSINQTGSIRFKATQVGQDTVLANIVKLVETAQNSKAPGQRIADKFAGYLVVLAVGSGLLTFAVWYFLAGEPVLFALTFAISAVVIACPDALGLATPTAVAVGTGIGAKHNILIKDAPTLEQVSKIKAVVLDKTGTLTEGKPKVVRVQTVEGFSDAEAIRITAIAEQGSSHPLSKSVLDYADANNIAINSKAQNFKNLAGLGIEAQVDGKNILVGTKKLMKQRDINIDALDSVIKDALAGGETIMILAIDNSVKAVIGAADPIKETAKTAISRLNSIGIETIMITGDNERTAEIVSKNLGISRYFAEVMPEDKAVFVKKLQDEGKFVAMVGDGVNDAPALAQANIGIAIGAGTDVAVETAKVVLMKSDPEDISRAIILSKATVRKMKQNLFWASIYNILAIPIAAGALYPSFGISLRPEVSALLMSVSSIIVALNAVSLRFVSAKLKS
ncbi:MAG: copper-translocating P-type ATPase [Candidatus Dojkabacteria bacterium]|nr:copper-translocating P-type ATPase [Candidatus Dojkabacteria bacterium]